MLCSRCDGDMEEKYVKVTFKSGNNEAVVDGIKALICPKCGQKIFKSTEVDKINEAKNKIQQHMLIDTLSIDSIDIDNSRVD